MSSYPYVPIVIAPATLSYQTDWACVETTTPGVSFRKDAALEGYGLYEDVVFTTTSVKCGKPGSRALGNAAVVPFLIIADGNPIGIRITKGCDREAEEDRRGSATVKFGGNSYQNDVASGRDNEKIFHDCPLPLMTTFVPRDPTMRPIQLVLNLANNTQNVYNFTTNSGGVPLVPSSSTVKVTVSSFLGSGKDSYDVVVAEGSPCLTQGQTVCGPTDVKSGERKEGNAGVYQSTEGSEGVRGAVGYILPGINSSILVIYFDNQSCRLSFLDRGTVIDADIVDKAQTEGFSSQFGSIVLMHDGSSQVVAKASTQIISENLVEMQVSLSGVLHRKAAPDLPVPTSSVQVLKIAAGDPGSGELGAGVSGHGISE